MVRQHNLLMTNRFKLLTYILSIASVAIPSITHAFCPVCTIAVGAGLGLSRYLRIDDLITGVWIGAVLMSGSLWFANYLKKKKMNTALALLLVILLYALTFIPMYYYGIIGHEENRIFLIDKLIAGTLIGTVAFPISAAIHLKLKKKNNSKSYFPFQSVAIPLVVLTIISVIIFITIR